VSYDRDANTPRLARQFITDRFGEDLDAEALHAARVVVSELVTNALQHGNGEITLRVVMDGTLRIEVTDSAVRSMAELREPDENGGRGLHIVDAHALAWGCTPDGTFKTVWAVLEATGPAETATRDDADLL
jgi:anti-sigma regulatory factor (Ser/Thr protein kinase)